jgi:starvation-inducible DNA-binding protein
MPSTRNDLPDNTRKAMIALLNARLADTIDLRLSIKQSHWNIKGPTFIALHLLFDEIQGRVDEFADTIAERAMQLGGYANGALQMVAKTTNLAPYPTDVSAEKEHLKLVSDHLAAYGKLVRQAIDASAEAGDADTADLFTNVSRSIDKDLWFVESHLQ